jgi:hypothetical protein
LGSPIGGTNVFWGRGAMSEAAANLFTMTRAAFIDPSSTINFGIGTGLVITDCVVARSTTQNAGISGAQPTITDLLIFGGTLGFSAGCVGGTITRFHISGSSGGGLFLSCASTIFTSCTIHHNSLGIRYNASGKNTFITCAFGTLGTNQTSDILGTALVIENYFQSCSFGSTTLISSLSSFIIGSLFGFHRFNATDNDHRWYTPYGSARSTGAGLADTTVRASGGLGIRIAPENLATGFSWSFNILAKASSIVNFYGFFQKNTVFGTSVATVELFLPGSTVADASATLTNVTGSWQAVALSALYSGTTDLLATITVTGKTATAAAYLYADDFYNATPATNKIAGLETWNNGQPVSFLVDTTFDAGSVWSYAISSLTDATTTGGFLATKLLTVAKFLGLK